MKDNQIDVDIFSDVTMECHSDDKSDWYFEKNGKINLAQLYPNEGNILTITDVDEDFDGTYFCYGSNENINEPFIAKAKVIVYGK